MKYMLQCLCIGEKLYFASELVRNDISDHVCTIRYISVSIIPRYGTSRPSTSSSFSQDGS